MKLVLHAQEVGFLREKIYIQNYGQKFIGLLPVSCRMSTKEYHQNTTIIYRINIFFPYEIFLSGSIDTGG